MPVSTTGGPTFYNDKTSSCYLFRFDEFKLNFSIKLNWKGISDMKAREAKW